MGALAKLIVAKGYEKLPKMQKIAISGHTASLPKSTTSFGGRPNWSPNSKQKGFLPILIEDFVRQYLCEVENWSQCDQIAEISPLWQKIKVFGQLLEGLLRHIFILLGKF